MSPGFAYGLKLLFVRSKVTSNKSITFMFSFAVIFSSSSLNFSHSFFLMPSFVLGFFFTTANPSSLYIPTSSLGTMVLICDRMNRPISLQVSAPLYDPVVTSKNYIISELSFEAVGDYSTVSHGLGRRSLPK